MRGVSGQRTQSLASEIYTPTRVKKYSDLRVALDDWDLNLARYEKISGGATEDTRIYSLRQLVPIELEEDIVRNVHTLKSYQQVREYVNEQVWLRRDSGERKGVKVDAAHGLDDEVIDELYKCVVAGSGDWWAHDGEDDEVNKLDAIYSFVKKEREEKEIKGRERGSLRDIVIIAVCGGIGWWTVGRKLRRWTG